MAVEKTEKEERATTTGGTARRASEADERKAASERAPSQVAPGVPGDSAQGQSAQGPRHQYLVALRTIVAPFAGPPSHSIDAIVQYLERQEGVEIVGRVKPTEAQPFAPNGSLAQEAVIVRMPAAKAETLRATAQPHIIVERDAALQLADGVPVPAGAFRVAHGLLPLEPTTSELALRLTGERDQPLARASVIVFGSGLPTQAVSDDSGAVRATLFGCTPADVRAIYVKPRANHWERLIVGPELGAGGATTIRLRPLSETFGNLASARLVPWNQRLLQLDPAAGNLDGSGVRIGLVASGCDNAEAPLRHVVRGRDFTARDGSKRGDTEWTEDASGYGTHAAGILVAAGPHGIVGTAPKAELHVLKVFPGGHLSDLLAALDECIDRELDVVCLNVSCEEPSELLDRKLIELRHKGIACIVAAGLQPFPAVLPSVLAVGAIGKLREFPTDTCHAEALMPELIGYDGLFPAGFTGAGPRVALAAPGVAVPSTVPGGYAALDGAGIAATHVAGLAALVLAHHPLFQRSFKGRSEDRVSTLFGLLRASAAMPFADPLRAGAGVPGLQRVPGMFGEMSAREFGSLPVTPLGGLSPILETFPSPTLASAWQMRTARWI
ncbi:MAG: S8 family serine peptidase [Alphaproteobacteria bacterium]|nr:S8 family serine peptidase [Alphaproteobacteria bacterium]